MAPITLKPLQDIDALAWVVQKRIITANLCAAFFSKKYKDDDQAVVREPGNAARARELTRQQVVSDSGHAPIRVGKRWRCATCQVVRPSFSLAWLRAHPCAGPAWAVPSAPRQPAAALPGARIVIGETEVHASHKLVSYRGVVWCWTCGCRGTASVSKRSHPLGLGRPCAAPTRSGRGVLGRLRKGLTPRSQEPWPEEDSGAVFPAPPDAGAPV